MPSYDYVCDKCEHTWEHTQPSCKVEDNAQACPKCKGKKLTRQFPAPAVHNYYSPMHPRYRRGMVRQKRAN
jgi:putative FmdB family regulatory protein